MRQDLRKIESQNQSSSSDDLSNFALDWYTLANTQNSDGRANQQWQKVVQLRGLLREYSSHSIFCSFIREALMRIIRSDRDTISPDVKIIET